jgi:hypothetical protein
MKVLADNPQLRLSGKGHFLLDTKVASSTSFDAVPFSCFSGLFDAKAEIWEWRTDVEPTEMFFCDDSHLVFNIGERFKMGVPGHVQKYEAGIYVLNCLTRKVTKSPLTRQLDENGMAGGMLVFLSAPE